MAYKKKHYDVQAAKEKRSADMQRLSELIKTEIEGFKRNPDHIAEYLKFASRFYRYSPNNQLLIMLQNPYADFTGSYQYYKKAGYSVLKGEKGIQIFAPATVKLCSLPSAFEGEKLYSDLTPGEKERIDKGEGRVKETITFKVGNVFDISQTDCPKEDYPKIFDPGFSSSQHRAIYAAVLDYGKKNGMTIEEGSASSVKSISLRGLYNPDEDYIVVRNDLSDTQKLATLIHEIGHKEMHNLNTDRPESEAQREFEADGYTVMLSEALGLPIEEGTKAHMHGAYLELIKEIPALSPGEPVFSSLDKNASSPGLAEKDRIERSLQNIVAKFNEAQKTMIPHIKEYLAQHERTVSPCLPVSLGDIARETKAASRETNITPDVKTALTGEGRRTR